MYYTRAFSYVFEDKDWLSKLLIAGLISLIPIVGQFYLVGWMVEIIRRVKAGRKDILPTTHFSYFLTLGLKSFVVSLVYMLPVIIVSAIISAFSASKSYDNGTFRIVISTTGFFGNLIYLLVQIFCLFLSSYGYIKLAETDQIKSCLDFKDAFNTMKENLSDFVIVELLMVVAGIIGFLGIILCFVGLIFTMPYALAMDGFLLGILWLKISAPKTERKNAVRSDDVVEAPFTRVQDIEKDAANSSAPADKIVIEVPETPTAESSADQFVSKVETTADHVTDKAEYAADQFVSKVETAADHVVDRANDAADRFVSKVDTAADKITDKAENIAEQAAQKSESTVNYVDDVIGNISEDPAPGDDDLPKFE